MRAAGIPAAVAEPCCQARLHVQLADLTPQPRCSLLCQTCWQVERQQKHTAQQAADVRTGGIASTHLRRWLGTLHPHCAAALPYSLPPLSARVTIPGLTSTNHNCCSLPSVNVALPQHIACSMVLLLLLLVCLQLRCAQPECSARLSPLPTCWKHCSHPQCRCTRRPDRLPGAVFGTGIGPIMKPPLTGQPSLINVYSCCMVKTGCWLPACCITSSHAAR